MTPEREKELRDYANRLDEAPYLFECLDAIAEMRVIISGKTFDSECPECVKLRAANKRLRAVVEAARHASRSRTAILVQFGLLEVPDDELGNAYAAVDEALAALDAEGYEKRDSWKTDPDLDSSCGE